ncbi:ead/Ea22-like family protein [Salmonella enterica]|uniref:ead/Ea22-like family protein n=1 Tax=Salmonella enterica TaxID=28901 RepID=UPI0028C4E82A|nr:ead/Ea22-like family protein [Salmonella enterica]
MSNIDKQALLVSKAKASAFTMGYISQFEASDIDSDDIDLQFEVDGVETGTTVSIVDECGHAAQIITALLDELEHYKSREERVTKLVMDNSTSWDALYKKLEAAEKRLAEQSAIVAAAEKLVRCKGRYHSELNYRALAKLFGVITPDLPPLEHENVHYADAANVEITALRQRIAELEAKLETADKLQDGAFRDGLKAGFSYGQTDDQSGFAQCMSAYSTRTDIGVKVE